MRRQRPLVLLAVVALAGGVSACGSDQDLSTQIPKSSPDLTVPTATTPAPEADASTSTTDTTPTTTDQTAPPAATVTPPAAPPAAAATGSPTTGGATPGTSTQAATGEFNTFCAQNRGAC